MLLLESVCMMDNVEMVMGHRAMPDGSGPSLTKKGNEASSCFDLNWPKKITAGSYTIASPVHAPHATILVHKHNGKNLDGGSKKALRLGE